MESAQATKSNRRSKKLLLQLLITAGLFFASFRLGDAYNVYLPILFGIAGLSISYIKSVPMETTDEHPKIPRLVFALFVAFGVLMLLATYGAYMLVAAYVPKWVLVGVLSVVSLICCGLIGSTIKSLSRTAKAGGDSAHLG